ASKLTSWVARARRCGVLYSSVRPRTCSSGSAAGISAALPDRRAVEEIVAPARGLVLDRADLVHELGQHQRVIGLQREGDVRVGDHLDQEIALEPGAGDAQVRIGGLLR